MAKQKKPKPKPADPERTKMIRRTMLYTLLTFSLIVGTVFGIFRLKRYVEKRIVFQTDPPKVVIKNQPVWMSPFLAEQICAVARPVGTHSPMDHQMLIDAKEMLEKDAKIRPWIKKVNQLRLLYGQKPGDTLQLDCEFRAPIALVQWGEYYWLVDGEGVKLPEHYTKDQVSRIVFGQNGRMNIRIVQGVRNKPPLESGCKWTGDDLAAGLDMVKLLYARDCAEEILTIDVSNFQGRRDNKESQIVLLTKYAPPTEIRWGLPLNATNFFAEIPAPKKLDRLQRVYNEFKRVDANRAWIDIRFDRIYYPTEAPEFHADGQ